MTECGGCWGCVSCSCAQRCRRRLPGPTYTDTFKGYCLTSDGTWLNVRWKFGLNDRGDCKVAPLLRRPAAVALHARVGVRHRRHPHHPGCKTCTCAARVSDAAGLLNRSPHVAARPCAHHALGGALLPVVLPGVARRFVAKALRHTHPRCCPSLTAAAAARAWCWQAKCDALGAACEAYSHCYNSYFKGSCRLSGTKMSESVLGLDDTWSYTAGSADGDNNQITKGNGDPGPIRGFTCHVKDPPPGQHFTLGAARRG